MLIAKVVMTNDNKEEVTDFAVCDEVGNLYATEEEEEAEAAGLDRAEFGATFCPEYLEVRQ